MRRRLLLGLGLTAAVAALSSASCLSPTLPLPPPDMETITQSPTDPTRWTITGTCAPGALVVVINDETGQGEAYEDRAQAGRFIVDLIADQCDSAWASQALGNDASARTYFLVEPLMQNDPGGAGPCQ